MSSRFGDRLRLLALSVAFTVVSAAVMAQAKAQKQFVTGEWMVLVSHGTPASTVADIASKVNAVAVQSFPSIDPAGSKDCYLFRATAATTDADTVAKVATLKSDARVFSASHNKLYYKDGFKQGSGTATYTPNDPRFNEQWDKQVMHTPAAWTLSKGSANVAVCVIDTGVDIDHPEFQGRLLAGFDVTGTTVTNDPRPTTGNDHGTHVAGIIMANGDNGTGIAGVSFQNSKLVAIKTGTDSGGFTTAALVAAFTQVQLVQKANPGYRYVINASLGSNVPTGYDFSADPWALSILSTVKLDIVCCFAAGNDGASGNAEHFPADMAPVDPRILCIASCGPNLEHSFFSSFHSYTTVTGPGGDDPSGANNALQILSTFPIIDGSYSYEQGTSMATPNVAGVVALLLGVPSVSASQIKGLLSTTAQHVAGYAVPSPEFGAGVVDAYAALALVSTSVTINTPSGTGGKVASSGSTPLPVETLKPTISIHVANVLQENVTVTLDNTTYSAPNGTLTPMFAIQNVTGTVKDSNGNLVPSNYDVSIAGVALSPGTHTVTVVGSKKVAGSPDITDTDTRTFQITPHNVGQGKTFVSFPYLDVNSGISSQPVDVLGTGFTLARWNPVTMAYDYYSATGGKSPNASFTPSYGMAHADGSNVPLQQIGLGYFSSTDSIKPVLTNGAQVGSKTIVIPLKGNGGTGFVSWNMVGDPFAFDVPFASCLVDTATGRITIQDAVNQGLILPTIYSYDSNSGYTFLSLPDGALKAWSGHWLGVTSSSDIALVVPPNYVSRGLKTSTTPIDGWSVNLTATVKGIRDLNTVIGTSTKATNGFNQLSVPKPPMVGNYVSIAVNHNDWANKSGLFSRDIRLPSTSNTWKVVVSTDQANSDVNVGWSTAKLNKAVRMTITDDATNQVYDMRTRTGLTFNSGSDATTRSFTITSSTAMSQPIHIANVIVRSASTRSTGVQNIGFHLSADATYDVKILNSAGSSISKVATRSVGAGDVQLNWNGKDGNGTNVAAGTYLVQIKAVGLSGDSVTVVYPFAVIR